MSFHSILSFPFVFVPDYFGPSPVSSDKIRKQKWERFFQPIRFHPYLSVTFRRKCSSNIVNCFSYPFRKKSRVNMVVGTTQTRITLLAGCTMAAFHLRQSRHRIQIWRDNFRATNFQFKANHLDIKFQFPFLKNKYFEYIFFKQCDNFWQKIS